MILPPNPKQAYGDKKVNLALVPPVSIAYEAMAFMEGARKYGPYNWREKSVEAMTYIAALQRHVGQWLDREEFDDESGNHHLAHAKACLGILIDAMTTGNLIDNRPKAGAMTRVLKERAAQGGIAKADANMERIRECPDLDQGAVDDGFVYAEETPLPLYDTAAMGPLTPKWEGFDVVSHAWATVHEGVTEEMGRIAEKQIG